MKLLKQHPNAVAGGLLGAGGIGQLVLVILNAELGVHLTERQGAGVAAAAATVVLAAAGAIKYAWANGAVGVWRFVRYGKTGPGPATSAADTGPGDTTVALHADIAKLTAQLRSAYELIEQLEARLEPQEVPERSVPEPPPAAA